MVSTERMKALMDVTYLCGCAVREEKPDTDRIAEMDLEQVYEAANSHLLTAAAGMALKSAGINNERFTQAILAAQRKNALLDVDRAKVLTELEKAGIWYMPLKGAILKELYPRYGMRQMADNDILFDASRAGDVRRIMEGMGFSTEHFDQSNHDVYHKKPVSNFEMHRSLFDEYSWSILEQYYRGVKDRLIKDDGNQFGYHFSPEDFYIYIVSHEYKHYSLGGTGIRSLLDTYVYLRKVKMDEGYVASEMEKLGISDYEGTNRQLSLHLFGGESLIGKEQEMLEYIFSSGTYGTMTNRISNEISQKGRLGYFLSRLSLPMGVMKKIYPILNKAPWLYPVMWLWRLVSKSFTVTHRVLYQLGASLGLNREVREKTKTKKNRK